MEGHALTMVALVEAFVLLALAVALVTVIDVHRRSVRNYQKREDGWANRVMHMNGFATYAPPPSEPENERPDAGLQYDHVPEPEV